MHHNTLMSAKGFPESSQARHSVCGYRLDMLDCNIHTHQGTKSAEYTVVCSKFIFPMLV